MVCVCGSSDSRSENFIHENKCDEDLIILCCCCLFESLLFFPLFVCLLDFVCVQRRVMVPFTAFMFLLVFFNFL